MEDPTKARDHDEANAISSLAGAESTAPTKAEYETASAEINQFKKRLREEIGRWYIEGLSLEYLLKVDMTKQQLELFGGIMRECASHAGEQFCLKLEERVLIPGRSDFADFAQLQELINNISRETLESSKQFLKVKMEGAFSDDLIRRTVEFLAKTVEFVGENAAKENWKKLASKRKILVRLTCFQLKK